PALMAASASDCRGRPCAGPRAGTRPAPTISNRQRYAALSQRQMRPPARQRVLQPGREAAPLAGAEEAAEDEGAAMRADGQPVALVGLLLERDAQPIGLEAPRASGAAHVDALDRQRVL